MFRCLLLAVVPVLALAAVGTAPAEVVVRLHDGTQLAGTLEKWDSAAGIFVLRSALTDQPFPLSIKQLEFLEFTPPPAGPAGPAEAPATTRLVELTNGDRLAGEFSTLSPDQARLQTSLGPVELDPSMIARIRRDHRANVLADLATLDTRQWKTVQARATPAGLYFDQGSQAIGPLRLPSRYRLSLSFNQPATRLSLYLNLHVDPRGNTEWQAPSYQFSYNEGQFGVSAVGGRGQNQTLAYPLPPASEPANSTTLTLLVDRVAGQMGVTINEGPLMVLHGLPDFPNLDDKELAEMGAAMQGGAVAGELRMENPLHSSLQLRNQGHPFVLSGLRLESWTPPVGGLRNRSAPRQPAAPRPGGNANAAATAPLARLNLVNGDSLEGKFVGVADSAYLLEVQGTKIPIPAARVEEIDRPGGENLARRQTGDALVVLRSGQQLVLHIDGLDGDHLIGRSDNLRSPIRIPLDQCLRLETGLYADLLPALHPTTEEVAAIDWEEQRQQSTTAPPALIGLPRTLDLRSAQP